MTAVKKRPRARVAVPRSVKSELDASRAPMTKREKRLAKGNALVSRLGQGDAKSLRKETRAQTVARIKTGKVSAAEKKRLSSAIGEAGDRGTLSRDYYVKVAKGLGANDADAQKAADQKYGAAQKRKASYDKRINPHTGKKIGMEGQGMPGRHVDHKTGQTYRLDRWSREIPGSRKNGKGVGKPLVRTKAKGKVKEKIRKVGLRPARPPKGKGGKEITISFHDKSKGKGRGSFFDNRYGGGGRAGTRRRRPRFPGGPPKGYAPFHRPHGRGHRIYAR